MAGGGRRFELWVGYLYISLIMITFCMGIIVAQAISKTVSKERR